MSITHSPTQTFPELRLARRECSGDDQRSCASSDDDYDDDYGDYDDDDDDDDDTPYEWQSGQCRQ